MRFDTLLRDLGSRGVFDFAGIVQLYDERRHAIRVQLHRWCASGKLLRLRRGMYAFAPEYSRTAVNPAGLANMLHAPSYLSTHWVLGYVGLIPERVVTFTSVTARGPRRYGNRFGLFTYRHVKRDMFFGYRPTTIDGRVILMANPEKALLDLWHLESGPWTRDRMEGMRFQNVELIDPDKLATYARRTRSRRAIAAADTWLACSAGLMEVGVEL